MEFILNYNEDEPLEDVLGTVFTIQVESFGELIDVELKEGGADIYVTKSNKDEYVELYVDYIFNK